MTFCVFSVVIGIDHGTGGLIAAETAARADYEIADPVFRAMFRSFRIA